MSILIEEKGKTFQYYVTALRGQFGDNLASLIHESNKEIFLMRKHPTDWFIPVSLNKMLVGKFYLINYDFNGNKLYCPIFTIDYRVTNNNKHVMYAINLDYLPFDYKMIYFNKMRSLLSYTFDNNADAKNFNEEKVIKVNFETIYKSLEKNGGYNFAISAFDITKIKECFGVSTNLMYLIIHVHMRPVNVALMKEQMKKYDQMSDEKKQLQKLVDSLDDITETYEQDIQEYYKKLRNIENNYKLFDK